MRIGLFAGAQAQHQREWLTAFQAGLKKHNQPADLLFTDAYRAGAYDLAVFWSAHQARLMAGQIEAGADFLILERGYIDRFRYTSARFNGLHGDGQACFKPETPSARGERWLSLLQPWRFDREKQKSAS